MEPMIKASSAITRYTSLCDLRTARKNGMTPRTKTPNAHRLIGSWLISQNANNKTKKAPSSIIPVPGAKSAMITMTIPTTKSKYAMLGLINISISVSSRGDLIIHQIGYHLLIPLCIKRHTWSLENLRIWYDIDMQPFSILLGLGVLLGLLLTVWRAPEKEAPRYLEAGLWELLGALVGGRLLTVVVNFSYYQSHAGEIVQVWLGGLSGMGALAGGILGVIILALWWKLPVGKLADMLLPLAGTLTIAAWLGCWVGGCGYGVALDMGGAVPGGDEGGVLAKRVPVQLLGAILTLVLGWL